jgi:hypothetical protein
MFRGGSFVLYAPLVRSASRSPSLPSIDNNGGGFRVARTSLDPSCHFTRQPFPDHGFW